MSRVERVGENTAPPTSLLFGDAVVEPRERLFPSKNFLFLLLILKLSAVISVYFYVIVS